MIDYKKATKDQLKDEYKRLSKLVNDNPFATKKEFFHLWGLKQIDVNLKDIVSVGGKTGMILGDIMIGTSGQNYSISNVFKAAVVPFTNLINSTRNNLNNREEKKESVAPAEAGVDIVSQLERLASLQEKGILTPEEFAQQKDGTWLLDFYPEGKPQGKTSKRIRKSFSIKGEALAFERYTLENIDNKPWLCRLPKRNKTS